MTKKAFAVAGLVAAVGLIWAAVQEPGGGGTLRVPRGLVVEKVAGSDLVSYPMMGTIDDRGRLFLCESSGNTLNNEQMAAHPDYKVTMLEDTDGDGKYDKATTYASKLTLPAGAVWYRGSLYVAAPPDLLRFTDTDGDGVADQREVVVTGWNMSSNAASLHGPFMGPDGYLYLTDGRHGFHIKTKDGREFEGKSSRIWRVRPDGTGLEWLAGGGFDNPVELVFTPSGETIGTMTYFQDPRDGQRDALLHYVEGGVYPKWYPVVSEFKRTGDLMPVMTKFARIAPAGLERYRGDALGPQYEGNLFSAQFNPHRVQRHVLHREGASFRTDDEDFLTSTDPDFHPTDVMEDHDGNLLVIDTGAWFIHGCPISRVAKPEIKGAVYRIRRATWRKPAKIAEPFARDAEMEKLVEAGDASVDSLAGMRQRAASSEVRCAAVWGLFRIGTPRAQEALRAALRDVNFRVRTAAARAAGMARDGAALDRLMEMARADVAAPARRQAAAALGQIGERRAVPALLASAGRADDRFMEHSAIYSLIEIGDAEAVAVALRDKNARVRKAALVALDQMEGTPLHREQVRPLLSDTDKDIRTAALWVVSHHADWSGEVLQFLDARLRAPAWREDDAAPVRESLLAFCADGAVQRLVTERLTNAGSRPTLQMFLLDTVDRCSLKEFPAQWVEQLGALASQGALSQASAAVRFRAVGMIRSRQLASQNTVLRAIAADEAAPKDLSVAAIGGLVKGTEIDDASLNYLLSHLTGKVDAGLRLSAAQTVGQAKLTEPQLLHLASQTVPKADGLALPSLLDAFRNSTDEAVGRALVTGLLRSKVTIGEPDAKRLNDILAKYPESVKAAAHPLLARLEQLQRERVERLRKMEPLLAAGGDIGRGRRIFFGEKVACSSCHTIGKEGGHVGPDLTAVGAIRSGHDLLEAIVFPSASFVPGHEVYVVETAAERYSGVRGEGSGDVVTLVTGPNAEVRIPRSRILSMKPSTVSLMPEGLDESLTKAEFIDLLAFLQAQKSREVASR